MLISRARVVIPRGSGPRFEYFPGQHLRYEQEKKPALYINFILCSTTISNQVFIICISLPLNYSLLMETTFATNHITFNILAVDGCDITAIKGTLESKYI